MNSPHSLLVLRGDAVTPYLDDVARLRIAVAAEKQPALLGQAAAADARLAVVPEYL